MDEIIELVGNFGAFQALLFAASSACLSVSAAGATFMMYGMYNPGWSCQNDTLSGDNNLWSSNKSSTSLYYNSTSRSDDLYNGNSRSDDVCASWRRCKSVVFDQSASTVVTEWNLMCDNAWKSSMIITVQMCGVVLGALMCGPLGDRFGRRVSMYTGIAVLAGANLICAFSSSWQMFAALRFFIGAGVGCIVSIAYVYPMEFVGGWWRPVLLSVPIWSIGSIQSSLIYLIFKDWRDIHFVIAGISAACFLPVFWIPESSRWLAVHGHTAKIRKVVGRMASWNRKPPVDVDLINKTAKTIIESQHKAAKPSYLDLFKTTKLRKYSVKFGLTWFATALVYYMITFSVQSLSGDIYINMILFALTEIPGLLCVGPLANKFGRRFTSCFFLIISGLACFGQAVIELTSGSTAGAASIVMVTVSKGALISTWVVLSIFSTELYPTVVRNLQSSFLNCASYTGAMLSGYMIPADDDKLFISFLVSGALLLLCAGVMFSVNESKGRRMADTIEELSEPQHSQHIEEREPLNKS